MSIEDVHTFAKIQKRQTLMTVGLCFVAMVAGAILSAVLAVNLTRNQVASVLQPAGSERVSIAPADATMPNTPSTCGSVFGQNSSAEGNGLVGLGVNAPITAFSHQTAVENSQNQSNGSSTGGSGGTSTNTTNNTTTTNTTNNESAVNSGNNANTTNANVANNSNNTNSGNLTSNTSKSIASGNFVASGDTVNALSGNSTNIYALDNNLNHTSLAKVLNVTI